MEIKKLIEKINRGEACVSELFDHGYELTDIRQYRDGVEIHQEVVPSGAIEVEVSYEFNFVNWDLKSD